MLRLSFKVNTDNDRKIFEGFKTQNDSVTHGHDSKKVVDKGEVVRENVSHHVHHVVQASDTLLQQRVLH